MCTVTFIKHKDGFSLTSNRDEQASRPTLAPQVFKELDQQLVYPKDRKAGGTWIASSNQNISVCLLNGAFKKHQRQLPYNRSRGQVLKERFLYDSNQKFIQDVNLENVEPFTLLMIDHNDSIDFMELVWDGVKKYTKNIDTSMHHIWASATLYNKTQRQNRRDWFDVFLGQNKAIKPQDTINFHTGSYTKDKANDMMMQRDQDLKTTSVSQININTKFRNFIYKDLETSKNYQLNLNTLCQTV
ncbi:NRDE family protein [Flavobacteriaceae bacterium 14752]|uniref:NRDE family protein n=1 Tax=Mesohalobacter salilacus TaxID=2491711 RepID=UPI000F643F70|nr:hypothetical protein EIG84_05535 [Flavobacteriaceae bacterium 14752]